MTDAVLTALVIIFICLLCAGLIVYTVFFAIHKNYFRKQINLVKKFNELINGLNGINIYKIQVLATNDLDEKLDENVNIKEWTLDNTRETVGIIIREQNTLFEDMAKKLKDFPQLKKMIQDVLFQGKLFPFNIIISN